MARQFTNGSISGEPTYEPRSATFGANPVKWLEAAPAAEGAVCGAVLPGDPGGAGRVGRGAVAAGAVAGLAFPVAWRGPRSGRRALILAAFDSLRRYGRGLPMNAFPPPIYVSQGAYRWLRHPIYVGFCLAAAGAAWPRVPAAERGSSRRWSSLVAPRWFWDTNGRTSNGDLAKKSHGTGRCCTFRGTDPCHRMFPIVFPSACLSCCRG